MQSKQPGGSVDGYKDMGEASQPSIFRAHALHCYQQGREKSVIPRHIAPKTFAYLWVLIFCLLALSLLSWLTWIPTYVPAVAIVVDGEHLSSSLNQDIVLAVLVEPARLKQIREGGSLTLLRQESSDRVVHHIIEVQEEIVSPEAMRHRLGLTPQFVLPISRPAAVAIATFEPPAEGLPATAFLGSIYSVEVAVGSRRAITLVPIIGSLVTGESD
jgi:hypothetical protein